MSGRALSARAIVGSGSSVALPGSTQTNPTGDTGRHSPRQPSPFVPSPAAGMTPPARTYPRTFADALGCSSTRVSHASAVSFAGKRSLSTGRAAPSTENGDADPAALAEGIAIIAADGAASAVDAASCFEHAATTSSTGTRALDFTRLLARYHDDPTRGEFGEKRPRASKPQRRQEIGGLPRGHARRHRLWCGPKARTARAHQQTLASLRLGCSRSVQRAPRYAPRDVDGVHRGARAGAAGGGADVRRGGSRGVRARLDAGGRAGAVRGRVSAQHRRGRARREAVRGARGGRRAVGRAHGARGRRGRGERRARAVARAMRAMEPVDVARAHGARAGGRRHAGRARALRRARAHVAGRLRVEGLEHRRRQHRDQRRRREGHPLRAHAAVGARAAGRARQRRRARAQRRAREEQHRARSAPALHRQRGHARRRHRGDAQARAPAEAARRPALRRRRPRRGRPPLPRGAVAPFMLAAYEFFTQPCLARVLSHRKLRPPFDQPATHYVLVEVEDAGDEALEAWVQALFDKGLVVDGTLAQSAARRASSGRCARASARACRPPASRTRTTSRSPSPRSRRSAPSSRPSSRAATRAGRSASSATSATATCTST